MDRYPWEERALSDPPASAPRLTLGSPGFMAALMDGDISADGLVTHLEREPSIAARLIGIANSAWSAPQSEISSIRAASARLGVEVVRAVSIALTVSSPFNVSSCSNFDIRRYWLDSLLLAQVADQLSASYNIDNEQARTCGLLRRTGLLWMASESPNLIRVALQATKERDISLSDALAELGRSDHLAATIVLLRGWDVPEVLFAAAQGSGQTNNQLNLLMRESCHWEHQLTTQPDSPPESIRINSVEAIKLWESLLERVVTTRNLAERLN